MAASRADRPRLTLPALRRLRRKTEFEAVYSRGRRFGNGYFSVTARSNDTGQPRLGLAVATKAAGNSVERNRIRRLIRESFRIHQHELPAVDLVVSARAQVRSASPPELRASLESLWQQVRERCASSPSS